MSLRGCIFVFLANAFNSVAAPVVSHDTPLDSPFATAVVTVASGSLAGVDLFENEAIQLTDKTLDTINTQTNETDILAVFGFDTISDSKSAKIDHRSGACKAFPGDWDYPRSAVWSLFDLLLGGSLIKTIPIAASCYKAPGCTILRDVQISRHDLRPPIYSTLIS